MRLSLPLVTLAACLTAAASGQSGRSLDSLDPDSRQLLSAAMEWGDRSWDDRANLIWSLASRDSQARSGAKRHLVRETSWYALGLLQRNRPGDRDRALRALEAVLAKQFHEPGEKWNGTFYRSPEEPHPPATAQMWTNYDPNWREFIGTTFAIVLLDWRKQLPPELAARLERSIQDAIEGEIQENRLQPSYTNIALMYGFLLDYTGDSRSREWATAVDRGFNEHRAFNEFNSPTYYGVDLYGLALWRVHGRTPEIQNMGSKMEAALWRSIAAFYNPALKNIAGPYDRSYGMDMRRYVSLVGLWMRTVLPADAAPFPELREPLDHADDLMFAPCAVSLGTKIPAEAMTNLKTFQGDHLVKQSITGPRVATAWIGRDVMLGAEFTALTKDAASPRTQFHPATVHWKTPGGEIGWVRLIQCPVVDAVAARNTLTITAAGDSRFRISAPGLNSANLSANLWKLPGLTVKIETDARHFEAVPADSYIDILYQQATHFTLSLLWRSQSWLQPSFQAAPSF